MCFPKGDYGALPSHPHPKKRAPRLRHFRHELGNHVKVYIRFGMARWSTAFCACSCIHHSADAAVQKRAKQEEHQREGGMPAMAHHNTCHVSPCFSLGLLHQLDLFAVCSVVPFSMSHGELGGTGVSAMGACRVHDTSIRNPKRSFTSI